MPANEKRNPTFEPFLAAIVAEPDNDAPRLIFADYLEESGDPRGELIRRKIAQSKIRIGEAAYISQAKSIRGFSEATGNQWNNSLADAVVAKAYSPDPSDIKLNVDLLIDHGEWLFSINPNLNVFLELTDDGSSLARLDRTTGIRNLQIGFEQPPANNAWVSALRRERLKKLWLYMNQLTENGVPNICMTDERIERLASAECIEGLESFRAGSSHISDVGLQSLLHSPNLARLNELRIPSCNIGGSGIALLAASPLLRQLESLDLMDVASDDLAYRAMLNGDFSSLKKLRLGGSTGPESKFGIEGFTANPTLQHLEDFELMLFRPSAPMMRQIANAENLAGLKSLKISLGWFDDAMANELAQSPFLTHLETLEFDDFFGRLTAFGVGAIVSSPIVQNVKSLTFNQPDASDSGIACAAFADSEHLQHLRHLRLWFKDISVEGAKKLAGAKNFQRLKTLSVRKLSDQAALAFVDSSYLNALEQFHIQVDGISKNTKAQLIERFGESVVFVH